MFLTHYNVEEKEYEIEVFPTTPFYLRTTSAEYVNDNIKTSEQRHFISGFFIDALAAYENTGLAPEEIKELQGDTLKRLKESNEILRKNNDEYYTAYQKLLDENHKLKSLLKTLLDKEELGD